MSANARMRTAHTVTSEREPTLTVTRLAYAPPQEIFNVLRTPTLHADFDPKQMIVSVDPNSADPITAAGQTFTMNMASELMGGDYRMVNHVTVYEPCRKIAWQPATEGYPPLGFQWTWSLAPQDSESTRVSLTYDWLAVTHRGFLAKRTFPMFPLKSFAESVAALVQFVEGDWGDEADDALQGEIG